MAACQAAVAGAPTLLLERTACLGNKLRITGQGRGNVTNTASIEEFCARFGPQGRFLRNAFHRFFSDDLRAFLADRGVPTVEERGGRVFPASQQASDIVAAFERELNKLGVEIRYKTRVTRLWLEAGHVCGVISEKLFPAAAVILATGGASYPHTGSTGDGYELARSVGHTIIPIRPALVPLVTAEPWVPRLQGLSLRNVRVTLLLDAHPLAEGFGEMLFTHFGVSGPLVLTLSGQAVDHLGRGCLQLRINLKPALDKKQLDLRLQRDLLQQSRRHYRTVLKRLLPQKLIPVFIELTGIPAEKPAHQITAAERARIRERLHDLRCTIVGHRPLEEALVTAGGVELREVNPLTMASRLVPGLFFAGEVLDLQADTGGYNLQAAFSTGYVAGRAAARYAL